MTMYFCLVTQDLIQIKTSLIPGTPSHGVQCDCGAQDKGSHVVLEASDPSHADREQATRKALTCRGGGGTPLQGHLLCCVGSGLLLCAGLQALASRPASAACVAAEQVCHSQGCQR